MEIRQIACVMAVGRHYSMLLSARVEVTASTSERWFAFANAMDMESVLPRWQTLDRKLDQDTGRSLHQCCAADVLAARVLE
jgi:hypothetical protein